MGEGLGYLGLLLELQIRIPPLGLDTRRRMGVGRTRQE